MNWDLAAPSWAEDDLSCGVWQFAAHLHPLLYSYLLVAIVYHAFVALFLDTRGHYERSTRRLLPLLLVGLTVGMSLVSTCFTCQTLFLMSKWTFVGHIFDNFKIRPFCSGSLCV